MTKLKERLKSMIKDQLLILDGLVIQYYLADTQAMNANKEDTVKFYWTAGGLQSDRPRAVSLNLTPKAEMRVHIETGLVPDTITAVTPETPGE